MFKAAILTTLVASASAATCDVAQSDACLKKGLNGGTAVNCAVLGTIIKCQVDDCGFTPEDCTSQVEDELKKLGCEKTCKDMASCFPATAQVELKNGQFKYMDQLVVGDEVRVSPSEFSEVFMFSTQLTETTSKFVKLSTDDKELSLTPGHFLYVNGELTQAGDVKVGDVVVLGNGTKASVTAVGSSWAAGLYNPHTLHGDIVVDGVRTSTYTNAVHPKLAHALLSPIRAMYTAGVSYGKGFSGVLKGLPAWVRKAITA